MISVIRIGARIILGLIYTVFGGMGLGIALGWIAMPEQPPMPDAAMAFMTGIMATGYFFPVLKITETSCGLLLLFNRATPAALIILAPITLQIILFHAFLTPELKEQILPLVMGLTHLLAMSAYGDVYKPLFAQKARKDKIIL